MTERLPASRLREFVQAAFIAAGVRPEHAAITSHRLIEADLRGRTGHGLMRVRSYIERVRAGGINLDPKIKLLRDTAATGLVDGDNGLGPVVMTFAAETAIEKARANGVAWVGTRNSNHAGAGGVYTAMALRQGLIGMYFAVAAGNTMPPWGGQEPLLGTNPLAVAVPSGDELPFQLDIATTVASHGSIRVKQVAHQPLPLGWVIDRDGNPITDATRADEGFLLPIGGYKGAGLTFMIGALAGVLNGAAFGREVVGSGEALETRTNTGQAILVIDPGAFMDPDEFAAEMDRQLRVFRDSGTSSGDPVRLAGERAAEAETLQLQEGIEVAEGLLSDLRQLAEELALPDRLD